MSFWETEEIEEDEIQKILQGDSPDLNDLIRCKEIISSFRAGDSSLREYLTKDEVFKQLVDLIFNDPDIRISKTSAELFFVDKSPLIAKLLEDKGFFIQFVEHINLINDSYRSGLYARIIIKCLETSQKTKAMLKESPESLHCIISHAGIGAFYELLHSLDGSEELEEPEEKYLMSVYAQILYPSPNLRIPKVFSVNEGLIKALCEFSYDDSVKPTLLSLLNEFLATKEATEEFKGIVSETVSDFSTAILVPVNKSLLEKAKELVVEPHKYDKDHVQALYYLAKNCDDSISSISTAIVDNFFENTYNTFHHAAFLEFMKQAMNHTQLRNTVAQYYADRFMEKKSSLPVFSRGYAMEVAGVVDMYISTDEWCVFRDNELRRWKSKKPIQFGVVEDTPAVQESDDDESDSDIWGKPAQPAETNFNFDIQEPSSEPQFEFPSPSEPQAQQGDDPFASFAQGGFNQAGGDPFAQGGFTFNFDNAFSDFPPVQDGSTTVQDDSAEFPVKESSGKFEEFQKAVNDPAFSKKDVDIFALFDNQLQ